MEAVDTVLEQRAHTKPWYRGGSLIAAVILHVGLAAAFIIAPRLFAERPKTQEFVAIRIVSQATLGQTEVPPPPPPPAPAAPPPKPEVAAPPPPPEPEKPVPERAVPTDPEKDRNRPVEPPPSRRAASGSRAARYDAARRHQSRFDGGARTSRLTAGKPARDRWARRDLRLRRPRLHVQLLRRADAGAHSRPLGAARARGRHQDGGSLPRPRRR